MDARPWWMRVFNPRPGGKPRRVPAEPVSWATVLPLWEREPKPRTRAGWLVAFWQRELCRFWRDVFEEAAGNRN